MLKTVTAGALAQWTQGSPLIIAYGWVRNAAYGTGVPVTYESLSV